MVRTAWPLLLALLLVITSPPFTHSLSFLTMKQRDVLVVGLNPALQRSVTLPNLVVGAVNRGASVQIGIGGKGQDVVVAAASMVAVPQPVLLQLLGKGAEGDTLLGLIKAVQPHTFVNSLSVRTQARCRTAITLVDASRQEATEIVEPSGTTSAEEVAMLLLAVERQYFQDKAGGVAVMGSMPPGCPPTLYADVLQRVVDAQSKVLLDTATGVDDALRVCRDVGCAALLKVNARELCALAGMPAATAGAAEAAHATPASTVLAEGEGGDEDDLFLAAFRACGSGPNKGQVVTRDELIKVIKHDFGLTVDVDDLMKNVDMNENGEIQFDSFKKILRG